MTEQDVLLALVILVIVAGAIYLCWDVIMIGADLIKAGGS